MTDLAHLRELAATQRRTLVEQRVRRGEDPAEVFAELPEIDDYVVRMLRDDALEAEGLAAEYALARHLQHDAERDDAADHRANADAVDARLLRAVGLEDPELTRAVWRALDEVAEPHDLVEPAAGAGRSGPRAPGGANGAGGGSGRDDAAGRSGRARRPGGRPRR